MLASPVPAPAAFAPRWPRLYRPTRGYRLLLGGLGLLALGGGVAMAAAVLLRGPQSAVTPVVLVGAGCVLLGAFLLAALSREQVLLFEDAIEFVELGRGRRRLRRDEILGRRVIQMQYGQKQLVLELRGLGRKPFKVSMICERDAVLNAWLAALPDLDALDRARAEAELMRAPELGRTEEERRDALAAARRISRVATGVSIGVMAWGWIYPQPYRAAIVALAVLPVAAIALLLALRGRFTVERRRNDARPGLELPLLFPGFVLMLRAILDLHVVDFRPLLAGTVLGALALVTLVSIGDPSLRQRWYALPLVGLFLAAHPYGALVQANALLDRSEPEVFRVPVIGKRIGSGKHTSYDLRLAAWGPYAAPEEVDVGRALYQEVEVGDAVCVPLSRGWLGARWYRVERCP